MYRYRYIFILVLWAVGCLQLQAATFRWDLTDDKHYSLSEASKHLLRETDAPIEVSLLMDGDLNAGFRRLKKATEETIEDALAHGMDIRYPDHIFTINRKIVDDINNHIDWVQVSVPYMTTDFVFCTRANAKKYRLSVLADPRNPVDQPTSQPVDQ
jgi:hypothetical protein